MYQKSNPIILHALTIAMRNNDTAKEIEILFDLLEKTAEAAEHITVSWDMEYCYAGA